MDTQNVMARLLAGESAPLPRPDTRPERQMWNNPPWSPPPSPYEGWQPQPLTPEQQNWIGLGFLPPPEPGPMPAPSNAPSGAATRGSAEATAAVLLSLFGRR